MKRIALVAFAVLAFGSTLGNATPAVAGMRCGPHSHWVRGHSIWYNHHRHWIKAHCS